MSAPAATPIEELYRHNLWANLAILDACENLDERHLMISIAGTYGTIADTLLHLFASEERYVATISDLGAPVPPLHDSNPFPGVALLRERARRSGNGLIDFAGRSLTGETIRGTYRRPYVMSVNAPLVQGINHATEHRTQIAAMLTQAGNAPPDMSGWAYAQFAGLVQFTDEISSS